MKREKKDKRLKTRWNTMQILAIGFLGVILIGAVLLWLPVSNKEPIQFMDALFTSVSAICVTGLMTITPATQFTIVGKLILMVLIQIGGLGVVACMTLFFLLLRKKITVKERIVIQESYSADKLGGIVGMIRKIIIGTFFVEGVGAFFYALKFVPQYGWLRGCAYAIFHAISAFCNAGIDILGNNSLAAYVGNPVINFTTAALIILGGLGFTVWYDVIENVKHIYHKEVPAHWLFTRLTLHSKLVLISTAFLLITGTLMILGMEYHNAGTIGNMSLGEKILSSFFQSVTTRTAGFSTFSQYNMHEESKFICCILMFIGGSQGGTAGGVKTATIAMLVLSCLTTIRGGKDVECFGRRISVENIRTGVTIVVISFLALLTGMVFILMLEPDAIPFLDILYESTSAIATVGLTADLTPSLCRASQGILMVLMYVGRVGPLTLALLFAGRKDPRDRMRRLPKERITVG